MTEVRPGRPEAAAVTWDWEGLGQASGSAEDAPSRARGVIQSLVGASVGTAVFLLWSTTVGSVILSIAAVILLSALLSPSGLYALIDRAFQATGRAVGSGLTWVLMPAMFFGFFWPFGALFRRGPRDAMRRFYDAGASTYWEDQERGRSASASSLRQF